MIKKSISFWLLIVAIMISAGGAVMAHTGRGYVLIAL
jgi:hypothetical protein